MKKNVYFWGDGCGIPRKILDSIGHFRLVIFTSINPHLLATLICRPITSSGRHSQLLIKHVGTVEMRQHNKSSCWSSLRFPASLRKIAALIPHSAGFATLGKKPKPPMGRIHHSIHAPISSPNAMGSAIIQATSRQTSNLFSLSYDSNGILKQPGAKKIPLSQAKFTGGLVIFDIADQGLPRVLLTSCTVSSYQSSDFPHSPNRCSKNVEQDQNMSEKRWSEPPLHIGGMASFQRNVPWVSCSEFDHIQEEHWLLRGIPSFGGKSDFRLQEKRKP